MRQLIINVPDQQFSFFMKLLRNLPWVQVEKTKRVTTTAQITPAEKEWVHGLQEALQEVEQREQGQRAMLTADEFLKKHAA